MNARQCFILPLFILTHCLFLLLLHEVVSAEEAICARVKIEIRQEVTFERQAFDAHMQINNGLTTIALEDVLVDVLFTNEAGEPVRATSNPDDSDALFFIRISSMDGIADVAGGGSVAPSTTADIHWLIIPAPASVADAPTGKLYFVGARLTYTLGGEEHVTEVTPDYITVKPMPLLQLDYFLPDEVYGDDPFTKEITEPSIPFSLGVRISNNGQGTAGKFKINSAQPKIIENEQGLLVDFLIEGSEVNGVVAPDTLLIEFGDISPGETTIGRWLMTCSLSGRFVEFKAEYSHADDLGGELTSLLEAVNTHFLVQDVLVDVTGRDGIRDFLGKDGDLYKLYESDAGISEVADLTSEVQLRLVQDLGNKAIYELLVPPTAGFLYCRFDDPQAGSKIISAVARSDGKVLKKENGWLSGKRVDAKWSYFGNIFDFNSSGTYIVTFIDSSLAPKPPQFSEQSDPVHKEGEELTFLIKLEEPVAPEAKMQVAQMSGRSMAMSSAAAVADSGTANANVTISVDRLPVGAEFIDLGNGTAILRWTPEAGQSGDYPLTFIATDGENSTKIRYHLLVTDLANKPTAAFSASPTTGESPLQVQFTDASQSVDGIVSWLWDFGDGSMSLEQSPLHTYDNPGQYRPSLTVTERDGDEHSFSLAEPIIVDDEGDLPRLETGKAMVNHDWQVIELQRQFEDPVVVASLSGATAVESAMVRVRDVTTTSFNIRLEEGTYADGIRDLEEVSYIVMERGGYTLEDGTIIVADRLESRSDGKFVKYDFTQPFSSVPVVTATITSVNDSAPANIVLRHIDTTGFDLDLQPEEAVKTPHGTERVDYIAWSISSGLVGSRLFEVGMAEEVDQTWQQRPFAEQFNASPVLVATRQSYKGHNPATVLCRNVTVDGVELKIAEETSHKKEDVGFIALSTLRTDMDSDGDGIGDRDERLVYGTHPGKADSDGDNIDDGTELAYWGDAWSLDADNDSVVNLLDADADGDGFYDGLEKHHHFNPADAADHPVAPIMKTGTVMTDNDWRRVDLNATYLDPVIVATITGAGEGEPASIRIKDIDSQGFSIRLEEGTDGGGNHPAENVSYVAMERAEYTLANGRKVVADHIESSPFNDVVKHSFEHRFSTTPVVVATVASNRQAISVNVAIKHIDKKGFDFLLQSEEAITAPQGSEQVDFIAWEPSQGLAGDYLFEVGNVEDVKQVWQTFTFKEQFNIAPTLVVSRQTLKGRNPATVLCRNVTVFDMEVRVVENATADFETSHRKEDIGFLAFTELRPGIDGDGDGITDRDEKLVYGTHPGKRDSDGDGIDDGAELTYWGASWSFDGDGDGLINLLDNDSDDDGFSDGMENLHGFNPADLDNHPIDPIMEVGSIIADHNWQTVAFATTYLDPIVVVTITGGVDAEPPGVHIKDIGSGGFAIRLEKGLLTDSDELPESASLSFIVMERGKYTLATGRIVIADYTESDSKVSAYDFERKLRKVPVVIGSLTSANHSAPAIITLSHIDRKGFEYHLESDDAGNHAPERVDFIVWEPDDGKPSPSLFKVGYFDHVDDEWRKYTFKGRQFQKTPTVAAALQFAKKRNPAMAICRNPSVTGLEVRLVEDTRNKITKHAEGQIGYIAIDGAYE